MNDSELNSGLSDAASWHVQFKDSQVIYIGNLDFDLSEGDIFTIFSQYSCLFVQSTRDFRYGEVSNLRLIRDKETGKSKGFAFLKYENQESTILAVDNFNGVEA